MDFAGKVVIITGSGAGMGQCAAVLFAERGARVVVNSRSASGKKTLDIIKEKGGEAIFVQADVGEEAGCHKIMDETLAAFGRIDILVNNAGVVAMGRVDNTPLEQLDENILVNVRGTFVMSRLAVIQMKKQGGGGVIMNNASVAAIKGVRDRAAYSASKGAVLALSKAMAIDHIDDNIRVNCICPGTTMTPSLEQRIQAAEDPAAMRKQMEARQPMKRFGTEAELAEVIVFGCSDEASFMTGSVLVIDGGMCI